MKGERQGAILALVCGEARKKQCQVKSLDFSMPLNNKGAK
jgi:hypothetical protein